MFNKFKKTIAIMMLAFLTISLILPLGSALASTTAGHTFYDQTDVNITYSDHTWSTVNYSSYQGGSARTTSAIDAYIEFIVDGTEVDFITATTSNLGIYEIYVDGVLYGTFDGYSSSAVYDVHYSITGLSNGTHTIKILNTGTKNASSTSYNMIVDGITTNGTLGNSTAPAEVTGLTATPGDTQVTLDFTLPTDSDFSNTKTYYKLSTDTTWTEFVETTNTDATATVTGLINDSSYDFKVTTVDTTGNESTGSTVTATPTTGDTTAPAEVTNLDVVVSDTTADMTFTLPSDTDFSHVNIYQDGVKINTTNVVTGSYSVSGLTPETGYTFKVTTVDTTGNESTGVSKAITTTATPDTTAPATPTNVKIINGSQSAYVEWDKNTETDLKGYNVYVDGVKHNTTAISTNGYVINGLTNGSTYSIQVSAVDTSNNESALTLGVNAVPSVTSVPLMELGYDLGDVAEGTTSWFSSLWLIIAFSCSIPLAFYVGNRIKLLFVG